ncbi:MAG: uroporphyrinogen decarboxylase family protein [Eubacteriales bacterium]|nr:uroporphyrinogen decarboxylase family protein [Eubacteriales bacterium]
MNNRERVINCILGREIDRAPFISYFGPWGETVEAWRAEGVEHPESAWVSGRFGLDGGFADISGYFNLLYNPGFVFEVLEDKGERYVCRDGLGIVSEAIKGRSGIPKIISNPVTGWDDWLRLREERLSNPEGRVNRAFEQVAAGLSDRVVQMGTYPYGFFGTLRDMIGLEPLCIMFYEQPDLIHDIMDTLCELWIAVYKKAAEYIKIDAIHMWEDMSGKSGSLISPAMIEAFMLPRYRRIKDYADEHNIPVMVVDTDGICDELIPLFESAGVNLMLLFEIAAGNDIVDLRRRFPRMAMLGGIDKLEIAKGPAAIDRELDKIEPLLSGSGYIPGLDHLIHPDISFADYSYYMAALRERIMKYKR